jgi:hypothetical protein
MHNVDNMRQKDIKTELGFPPDFLTFKRFCFYLYFFLIGQRQNSYSMLICQIDRRWLQIIPEPENELLLQ